MCLGNPKSKKYLLNEMSAADFADLFLVGNEGEFRKMVYYNYQILAFFLALVKMKIVFVISSNGWVVEIVSNGILWDRIGFLFFNYLQLLVT